MSDRSTQDSVQSERWFQVAGWTVQPHACRLEKDGVEVRVEPKVMELLEYLVEHAGQVVSRQELEACVWSGTVVGYEAVTNAITKLRKALGDEARHPRIVETISKHGYRLVADIDPVVPRIQAQGPRNNRVVASIALLSVLVVAAGLGWYVIERPATEPASVENMAFPLPKEPSLAVLPFDNLSGDPDQEYLADGITEEIITVLAKSPYLFVVSRKSTFVYKGAASVKQVAEALGVRYVLEGSVQRSQNRIRITAQLIDALTGHHIWAERYDREFGEIFALQDDITERIMVALHVEISEGEDYRVMHARVRSPEAFDYLMKARVHGLRASKEDKLMYRELVAKAVAIEPDNPEIWLYQAWDYYYEYYGGWSDDRDGALAKAIEFGTKAYAADPNDSAIVGFMGVLCMTRRQYESAVAYGRRSVALAPSSALDKARLAWILSVSGYPEDAIPMVQRAMRLSPSYPGWFTAVLAFSYMLTEDYEKAISAYEQMVERRYNLTRAYVRLAAIYAALGDGEKAHDYAEKLLQVKPDFTIQGWSKTLQYRYRQDLERELGRLRMAGLPEGEPN